MNRHVYSDGTFVRVGLLTLLLSFFIAAGAAFFSTAALAQEADYEDDSAEVFPYLDTEKHLPTVCEVAGVGELSVVTYLNQDVVQSGATVSGHLAVGNVTSDEKIDYTGYVFLRAYDEGGLGYPVALVKTKAFTVAANDYAEVSYELLVPSYVTEGLYVLETYVGQYGEETALALALSDTAAQAEQILEVTASSDPEVTYETFLINAAEATPGKVQLVAAEDRMLIVELGLKNSTDKFLVGDIAWELFEGLLPSDAVLVETKTDTFQLIPNQVYNSVFSKINAVGTYLLTGTLKTPLGEQTFLVPVVYGNSDTPVMTAPYVTGVDTNESLVTACVSYLRATLSGDDLPPLPLEDTVAYQVSAGGGASVSGELVFTAAPEQVVFEEKVLTGKDGDCTVDVELLKGGEVVDSLETKLACGSQSKKMVAEETGPRPLLDNMVLLISLAVVVVLVVVAARHAHIKRGRNSSNSDANPEGMA